MNIQEQATSHLLERRIRLSEISSNLLNKAGDKAFKFGVRAQQLANKAKAKGKISLAKKLADKASKKIHQGMKLGDRGQYGIKNKINVR